MKKRILFVGEASYLATGYSTLAKEIITAFHKEGKYDIAEMGSYGHPGDPRSQSLPWKFYGVLPTNAEEEQIYKRDRIHEFGDYKIDAVLADYQPDIVFDVRDPWMVQHLINNKYRDKYKLILMPTVDSAPQKKEWIDKIFKKADFITAYSRFGRDTLVQQGVKVSDITSPGVDLEIFKPVKDKLAHRDSWCINKKLLIIGTVMRNQKRKLFPDLFKAYAELRKKYKGVAEVERSVLLCHTSWPDVGWDLPDLLERYEIAKDVIFTYKCDGCKNVFHSWFIPCDGKGMGRCHSCGELKAHMPNTHNGVTPEELAEIYNLMDIYVQPAICEGWGMPVVEAKACGVPGLYQDYSALHDHVENGGGLPIEVGHFFVEAETMAERSYPSQSDLVKKLHMLLTNRNLRVKLGKEARECAEKMHGWKITTDKLISLVDGVECLNRSTTWDLAPRIKPLDVRCPANLQNDQFLVWCYRAILGREPDTKGMNDWMHSLSNGTGREQVMEFFRNVVREENTFEMIRWKASLAIRGVKPVQLQFKTNQLPGMII